MFKRSKDVIVSINRKYGSQNFRTLIGKKIQSSTELNEFFNTSSWSTSKQLENKGKTIDHTILANLLDLSGLSKNISSKERESLLRLLSDQVNLIAKLGDANVEKTHGSLSRLVDDKSVKPFNFESLMKSIEFVKSELSKGERKNSWNPLSLASEHQNKYFLVKEGLEKKNK